MKPAIRLGALMELPVVYVFTHDSIGVGEDGPTHQPVEQLAGAARDPGPVVLRPADANEVAEAWRVVLSRKHQPACLILSRQNLPTLDRSRYAPAAGVARGAYVLADAVAGRPEVILIGTGSEVALCVAAYERLGARGSRRASSACRPGSCSKQQDEAYRDAVLPPGVSRAGRGRAGLDPRLGALCRTSGARSSG